MITRAYCHRQAVRLWDENGVTFGFKLENGQDLESPRRPSHSESECKANGKPKAKQPAPFKHSVLPADFRL